MLTTYPINNISPGNSHLTTKLSPQQSYYQHVHRLGNKQYYYTIFFGGLMYQEGPFPTMKDAHTACAKQLNVFYNIEEHVNVEDI